MEITNTEYSTIKKYIQDAKSTSLECEFVFTNKITSSAFKNVFQYLLSNETMYTQDTTRDTLDVSMNSKMNNNRLTVDTIQNISNLCKGIKCDDYVVIKKKKLDRLILNEYSIRLNLKDEIPVEDDELKQSIFDSMIDTETSKIYRQKKRFTFVHKNNNFKIDLTIVKQAVGKSIKQSKLFNSFNNYEIEVEFLNTITTSDEDLVYELIDITGLIWKVMNDTNTIMKKSTKDIIITNMIELINPTIIDEFLSIKNRTIGNFINDVYSNPQKYFITYQPVTLQSKHLLPIANNDLNHVSILSSHVEYCVTDKADGERYILYVDSNKSVYLINNRFDVIKTDIIHDAVNTIIDGEFIKLNKFGMICNKFMAFDIYVYKKKNVRDLPLLSNSKDCRVEFLHKFCTSVKSTTYKINTKSFYSKSYNNILSKDIPSDIDPLLLLSRSILDASSVINSNIDYKIDGLIYTPVSFKVGAMYENEDMDYNYKFMRQNWNRVFKWKPSNENTIDFLIRYNQNILTDEFGNKYVSCNLYAAGSGDEHVNPFEILNDTYILNYNATFKFAECYLQIQNGKQYPHTILNEDIYSNTIVEFSYNTESSDDTDLFKWIPNRIRFDKTELYQKNNKIRNTANNINVAHDVMYSINNPITVDDITGKSTLKMMPSNDVYYERSYDRNRMLSLPLLEFHNWIKLDKLFNRTIGPEHTTLLDIGCGKAGDLNKWMSTSISTVIGCDLNLDNILNSKDGAYARLHNYYKKNPSDHRTVIFTQLDGTADWTSRDTIIKNDNVHLHKINSLLWNTLPNTEAKSIFYDQVLRKLSGAIQKIDVVSCQFALHYFFESDKSLETFCKNLDFVMKPNSIFMGTCLDSSQIVQLLYKKPSIHGFSENHNMTIWQIDKLYDDYITSDNIGTGKQIDVYMESIGKSHNEYLVDIKLLINKLKKYNIQLIKNPLQEIFLETSIVPFANFYQEYCQIYPDATKLSDILMYYSRLNIMFFFKKY